MCSLPLQLFQGNIPILGIGCKCCLRGHSWLFTTFSGLAKLAVFNRDAFAEKNSYYITNLSTELIAANFFYALFAADLFN